MTGELEERRRAIASRLRLAREMAGLSQSQVATLLGLNRPSVSEMEAGRRRVAAEELAQLATIYGVDVVWLSELPREGAAQGQERVELAARELAKLKPADLERVLTLLQALKPTGKVR